jgi:hypothetical protein
MPPHLPEIAFHGLPNAMVQRGLFMGGIVSIHTDPTFMPAASGHP